MELRCLYRKFQGYSQSQLVICGTNPKPVCHLCLVLHGSDEIVCMGVTCIPQSPLSPLLQLVLFPEEQTKECQCINYFRVREASSPPGSERCQEARRSRPPLWIEVSRDLGAATVYQRCTFTGTALTWCPPARGLELFCKRWAHCWKWYQTHFI